MLGVSRGAELALLAASTYPDLVGAVAAIAPSVHLWPAFDTGKPSAAAWTHQGSPLPFLPDQSATASTAIETMLAGSGTDPGAAYINAAIATASPANRAAARIPLDRITSPVLLATGAADALWPSAQHCQDAVDRLGPGHRCEHVSYRGAGHRISLFPTAPISTVVPDVGDGTRLEFGGTDQATAAAAADLWGRLPAWLANPRQRTSD